MKFLTWVLVSLEASAALGLTPPRLELDHRAFLPTSLAKAADIRFADALTIVVSAREVGVARVTHDGRGFGEPTVLLREGGAGGVVMAEHLGLSRDYVAVASPLSQLVWTSRGRGDARGALGTWDTPDRAPISFFEDIDLHGERLAILGLMRSETGMSRDGAIAWLGELGAPAVELRPFAYAKAGPGARPFDVCAAFAIGKVRFLKNGTLLLVPGAESGAYLYSAKGELVRAWDTRELGVGVDCDLDDEALIRFGSDVRARLEYVNKHVTVDEILPTHLGPALLLRTVDRTGTRWKLAVLGDDGSMLQVDVPLTSASRNSHLRGDVLEERVILLLNEFLAAPGEDRAELIELRWKPAATTNPG